MTTSTQHKTSDHYIGVNAAHHTHVYVRVDHITMIDHDSNGRAVLTFSNGRELYTNDPVETIFALMDEEDD